MVSKSRTTSTNKSAGKASKASDNFALLGVTLPAALSDKAQHIWAAGLAAFSKAQAEGGKVNNLFESMVKEGMAIQQKTQGMAEARMQKAQHRVSALAKDITATAAGRWDKLEGIFEERVAKVLEKMGIPSARDTAELLARIEELNKLVMNLTGTLSAPKSSTPAKSAPAAKKPAVRKSAAPRAAKVAAKKS